MRRREKEIVERILIDKIIAKGEICRLGLCDEKKPYIVPMNYGYKDNILYFHCAKAGRKLEILKKNNNVCFEIENSVAIVKADKPCKWTTKYYCVIGNGLAEIIDDYQQKVAALNIIMQNYSNEQSFNYEEKLVENIFIIKIIISEVTGKQSGY